MAGRDRYLPPSAASTSSSRVGDSSLIDLDGKRTRSALLEDRIEIQHREIQSLLADNQRLAVAHIALKNDLTLAKRELQQLLETAAKVKAERDAKVREVYQNAMRMEAEARVIDGLGAELNQVKSDVQRLATNRQELMAELAVLDADLAKVKPDSDRAKEAKAEIETLRQEIDKGRPAVEREKKSRANNLHHERGMEKTIDHLNRELVKLREELVKWETKSGAAIATADAHLNPRHGNPGDNYGDQGHQYHEANGAHQVYGGSDHILPQHPNSSSSHPPNNFRHSSVP